MEELKYWLAFNNVEGLGAVSILKIRKHFKSMKEAWSASAADYYEIPGIQSSIIEKIVVNKQKIDPHKLIDELNGTDIKVICVEDKDYPYLLKQIYDPPVVLYYRGDLNSCNFNRTIAIVGTRSPSEYAREISYRLGKDLGSFGATVVSGLAEGIDSAAHSGCISANGKTIAVLGSGLNKVYPKTNINLARQIYENGNGVVVSEYPPDSTPDSWRFPYRNRVISGLSVATIVVESKERGGGLITARNAIDHNREIFAIPSRVDNPGNDGVHNLLIRGEARIFTSYDNLFDVLNWEVIFEDETKPDIQTPEKAKEPDDISATLITEDKSKKLKKKQVEEVPEIPDNEIENETVKTTVSANKEESIILHAIGIETLHFDNIVNKTNFETSKILGLLTLLELKGLITQLPGKRYKQNTSV